MKGIWKPYSQVIGDDRLYIAGRQLDMGRPLEGGNIEYHGGYTADRDTVERECKRLNMEDDADA